MSKKSGQTQPCKNAPNCDGEVRVGARGRDGDAILECKNCRARLLSWLKRKPWNVLAYVTELRKRTTRMEDVRKKRDIKFEPTYRR